ncbi:hypothetical protein BACCELL_04670 [Bacteroides cellulosilyticus DSM 14838]|uniref:Uncharacterized protein n=1 Tax=Bacteroides cellulosilyticus DSM 14838 TaxID=537012 RepID=E2NK30_9BACE|nr:hypothetical protein BACCELL_04670 [Bacteroides cellulosilyticus DSM 14838]
MCGRLILHFVPTKLRNIEEEGTKDSDFYSMRNVFSNHKK